MSYLHLQFIERYYLGQFWFSDGLLDVVGLWFVPIHAALCQLTILVLRHFGTPSFNNDLASRRRDTLRLFTTSFLAWLVWCSVAHAFSHYWMGVSWPLFTVANNAVRMEAMIDVGFWPTLMPYLGGILGYILTVLACARWQFRPKSPQCESGNGISTWSCCVSCGYEALCEVPCPECGLPNPRMLRRAYFGRWHATILLSRHRWVAWLPWGVVLLLLFWPLISGVLGSL